MKILIVTGKLAVETIKEQTKRLKHNVDVISLPVTVAAFITPAYAAKQLAKKELSAYDRPLRKLLEYPPTRARFTHPSYPWFSQ